jgi:large subunit ribosomal protein L35
MPKQKTHKGSAKRMKRTGTGKIMRTRANSGHLKSGRSQKRKRKIRKPALVSAPDMPLHQRLLKSGKSSAD